jgi:hypothetical protein
MIKDRDFSANTSSLGFGDKTRVKVQFKENRRLESTWKMERVTIFLMINLMLHQCTYASLTFNADFEHVPVLDDSLDSNQLYSLFSVHLINSRLLCGAKCVEHLDLCRSYAWNRLLSRCLLYTTRFHSFGTSIILESGWQHYNVKGKSGMQERIQDFLGRRGSTIILFWNTGNRFFLMRVFKARARE